ncbi:MAG: hypothetical protein HY707_00020 [Ignavibacteriae bacterium]|nr:hypothetical protein [Ignavibacteriota bacterium]
MNNMDDSHNPLRKLLKGLPKVKASEDFEARLQRRITSEESRRPILGRVFAPRRIPVFAYSLVTIVAVCLISYYVFFRTGNVPMPTEQEIPATRSDEITPSVQVPSPERSTDDKTLEKAGAQKGRSLPKEQAKAIPHLRTSEVQQEREKAEEVKEQSMPAAKQGIQPPMEGQIQMNQEKEADESRQPERLEMKKEQRGLESPMMKSLQHLKAPAVTSFSEIQLDSAARDSAALTDSLRLDSLRQLQKLLPQKKTKRPNN